MKNKTCISEIILNYKVNFSLNLLHVCLTQRYKLGKYRTIKFQKAFFLIENAFCCHRKVDIVNGRIEE